MIIFTHHPVKNSEYHERRMRKYLETELRPGGQCVSRSGWSASLFMNMCEAAGLPFTLQASPGSGYHVIINDRSSHEGRRDEDRKRSRKAGGAQSSRAKKEQDERRSGVCKRRA